MCVGWIVLIDDCLEGVPASSYIAGGRVTGRLCYKSTSQIQLESPTLIATSSFLILD